MTQAKIKPGKADSSLAGKAKPRGQQQVEAGKEKDLLPELGLKSPAKKKQAPPRK